MNFFFDHNLSHRLAHAMRLLDEDETIIHLTDRFPNDTADETWLEVIGREDMILITKDLKIRKHPAELEAIRRYRVGAFFLIGKDLNKWMIVKQLVLSWENIKTLSRDTPRPFAFQVPLRGKITRLSL